MTIILNCFNLLGDSLLLIQSAKEYAEQNSNVVAVYAHPGIAFEMFAGSGFKVPIYSDLYLAKSIHEDATVLSLDAGAAAKYACSHKYSDGKEMYISDAYASILGIRLSTIQPCVDWQRLDNVEQDIIAIAPFSRSCTRHSKEGIANKTLDDWKWEYIIRYLRRQDLPIKVLGSPTDRLTVNSVPLDAYMSAANLLELEHTLKRCALFVTLDNGLAHVASALDVPTIILWPKVSSHNFIAPRFGKNTMFMNIGDPNAASPAAILCGLRHLARFLLGGITHELFTKEKPRVGSQSASAT